MIRERVGYTKEEFLLEELRGPYDHRIVNILVIGAFAGPLRWTDGECERVWEEIAPLALSFSVPSNSPERGPVLSCLPAFMKSREELDQPFYRGGSFILRKNEDTLYENRFPLRAVNLEGILEIWKAKKESI